MSPTLQTITAFAFKATIGLLMLVATQAMASLSGGVAKGWVLTSRPTEGPLTEDYFDLREYDLPELDEGDFLLKTQLVSLDPTHRIWASDAPQYRPPQPLGLPMRAGAIGVVEESRNDDFKVGSTVKCVGAWASRVVVKKEMAGAAQVLRVKPDDGSKDVYMGLLGAPGLTAYHGYSILDPKGGEGKTFVVDGAAGSVGSLILQIMKHQAKCRCIAICGSDEKAQWTKELGADFAINYKTENVEEKLREYAPDGVDYVFENVGGELLSVILGQMNNYGKIVVCGLISQYGNQGGKVLQDNFQMILHRRLIVTGFICSDFFEQFPDKAATFMIDLLSWHQSGQLEFKVDKQTGLENILQAYDRLRTGKNTGKLIVEV